MAPLSERDRNKGKTDGEKRKLEAIDLTGDSDDEHPPAKVSRPSASKHDQYRTVYQTPPPTSSIRSSQSHGSSFGSPQRHGDRHGHGSQQSGAVSHYGEDGRSASQADDDRLASEILSSTQAAGSDTEQLQLYGNLRTKIVGVQYYRGYASSGEQILIKREPNNRYDRNAIRIDNVAGMQIGHIPRTIAAKLARFLDSGSLHVEGDLAGGIGEYDCPLMVHIYGPDIRTDAGALLAAEMRHAKLPLDGYKAEQQAEKQREKDRKETAKRRQREEDRRLEEARRVAASSGSGDGLRFDAENLLGFANSSQAGLDSKTAMADLIEASQRFLPREIGRASDQYGVKEEALKNMPLATKPLGIKTKMLPHQLQALKWLLEKESPALPSPGSKDAVQLWKRDARDGNRFTNLATLYSTREPRLASGGILADDMGLGKTLEMISLILADSEKHGRKTGTTLICCPLSVISNWRNQCEHHLHDNSRLKIYVYHGQGRGHMTRADFAKYDVVISTYGTLSSEFSSFKGTSSGNKPLEHRISSSGLYCMEWRRVILDEGHIVRNPASKGAAAVTSLSAQSRWVLTGTPIVNSLRDLYSLLRFIGITGGLENLEIFNRVLVRPLRQGDHSAVFLLQAIMTALTLRRRKEMAFIDLRLPRLDEYIHRINFTTKERERYEALYNEAQGRLSRVENKAGESMQHLLEVLLRMRQCCNHWQLCKERVTSLLAQLADQKIVDLTPDNQKALQDLLRVHIQNQEDCSICLETLHNPVITACGHPFGGECISRVIELQKKCPMCRAQLKDDNSIVAPPTDGADEFSDDALHLTQSSSKLETTMQILDASRAEGNKTVIFSQWTRYLDIVQARLDRDGYKYCRIDGTMVAARRDAALDALDKDPECTIMLASLGVCAVGLNLTAANQVILSDTWWAPAIEDQAVDRIHRLGQTRETRVFRLLTKDSIEERTLDVQKEKRALASAAFNEREGKREGAAKTGRLADIQKLLRPGKHDQNSAASGDAHAARGASEASAATPNSSSGSGKRPSSFKKPRGLE